MYRIKQRAREGDFHQYLTVRANAIISGWLLISRASIVCMYCMVIYMIDMMNVYRSFMNV